MDLAVRYGPEPDHLADVVFPPNPAAPLVLVLHGGSWLADIDRSYLDPVVRALTRHGFAVANVEYRRVGGGGGWPATFDDVALAVATLPGLIDAQRPGSVDVARTVVLGHSAGGTLALWAVHRGAELAGVVALAPVADLADAERREPGGTVAALLGGGPEEVPDRYAAADPAALGRPEVPVVLLHGDRDSALPVELSRAYAGKTGAELLVVPGAGHFDVVAPDGPAWTSLVDTLTKLSTVERG
ncbi:alpha/beta hydrolase family protein [Amycolatopsis sp. NPDC051903]|uniref:alpha/beta hydrolase family protein n=1 Tax=Amycolatopsis sp. NPDC051903 TaxID=3363936 RepID=UPI00379E3289